MQGGEARIPVTLITGFLGSGKTSLLNRLLREPAFSNSAVLVNEFGEVGIDHQLIATARDRVLLLESGCLCCVLADSLRETLADLFNRRSLGSLPRFERVIIETSGLADPGPILQSLLKDPLIAPCYRFDALLCVVDALHGTVQLRECAEARAQVAVADRLLVSKLDICQGAMSTALLAELATLNPAADIHAIAAAPHSVAPLFMVTAPDARAQPAARHAHAQHSSGIVSCSFRLEQPVSWAGVAAWTGHLVARYGDELWRCKALLRLSGRPGRVVVHGVKRIFDHCHDSSLQWDDHHSPIVFIGRGLDRTALQSGLAWLQAPAGLQQSVSAEFPPWLDSSPPARALTP